MVRKTSPTKQKLIDVAIDLIWQNSYSSVGVDEICKASGVQKGSFYHFFPSKIDLALAAIDQCYVEHKQQLDHIFSAATPAIERFDQLAQFIVDHQKETLAKYGKVCGCPLTTLGSELAGQDERVRQKVDTILGHLKCYYIQAIRDLREAGHLQETNDIEATANALMSFVLGQKVLARIQNSVAILEQELKPGINHIIGLQNERNLLNQA